MAIEAAEEVSGSPYAPEVIPDKTQNRTPTQVTSTSTRARTNPVANPFKQANVYALNCGLVGKTMRLLNVSPLLARAH